MARYVKDLVLNKPDDFVHFIMNDYLQKNQFSMSDWKGEPAYRAGDAMVEGFKYLKWSYRGGTFHLEAWLRGTAGGEWDLDGMVGALMKKPYKKSLEELFVTLQQEIPVQPNMQQGSTGPQAGQAQEETIPQGGQNPQPISVKTVDNTGAATAALVFGILSVVMCWIPLVSLILGILGISRARMGSGSSKAGQAKAGKVLCIVGICLAAVLWLFNIILTFAIM